MCKKDNYEYARMCYSCHEEIPKLEKMLSEKNNKEIILIAFQKNISC